MPGGNPEGKQVETARHFLALSIGQDAATGSTMPLRLPNRREGASAALTRALAVNAW